ncbi:MAG: hypothetical protein ACRDLB_16135 [Actinomycetota bacterium]
MTSTSYLRVYQPLSVFSEREREAWVALSDEYDGRDTVATKRWLLRSALPLDTFPAPTEGAFIRRLDGALLVCPWRTRLRMLAGLLAFRGSMPDEVAEAFVSDNEARHAARELARLEEDRPDIRSHIIHANWHVPLRWFAAFEDTERVLTEDKQGLRIRYESQLSSARARLTHALKVLETSWIDEGVTAAVRELRDWLGEFSEEGLLELDYASVARTFSDEDLVDDHSAAEVWNCLEALESGDVVKAGRTFTELTDRWTEVRAREVVN